MFKALVLFLMIYGANTLTCKKCFDFGMMADGKQESGLKKISEEWKDIIVNTAGFVDYSGSMNTTVACPTGICYSQSATLS